MGLTVTYNPADKDPALTLSAASNTSVGTVTSQSNTRAIDFVPPQNNYILGTDGNLLDPILNQVEGNSAPSATGINYQTSNGLAANVITSVVVPVGQTYDGIALFVGSSGPIANTSQLFNANVYNGNTLIASSPATLNVLPTEQSWVFFKFTTPVTSNTSSYNWTVKASSESSVPVNVRGNSSTLAFLLRNASPSTPALNSTLNVYILGEAQGNNYINHTLTLNPTTDTSLGAIVVCKGGTLSFPSAGTYNMRLYDGIYLYDTGYMDTGSNDVNLDQYTIYNAQSENIGRSYSSIGSTTVVIQGQAIASASSSTTFPTVTSSTNLVLSQLVAASSSIGMPTGQLQGLVTVSSAQNTPVLNLSSDGSGQVRVSVSSNAVFGSFSSNSSIRLIDQATSNTSIGTVSYNTSVGLIVGASSNSSIGLASSNGVSASIVSSIHSSSIGLPTSDANAHIVVLTQGSSQIDPFTSDATGGPFISFYGALQLDPIATQASAKVLVSADNVTPIDNISGATTGLVRVASNTTTVIGAVNSDTDIKIKVVGSSLSSIGTLDALELVEPLAPITSNTSIGQTSIAISGLAIASAVHDASFGNFTNVIKLVKSFLATEVSQIEPIVGEGTGTVQIQNITNSLVPVFSQTTDIKVRVVGGHFADIGIPSVSGSFGAIASATSNTSIGLGQISGTFGAVASAQVSSSIGTFKSNGSFSAIVTQSTAMMLDNVVSSNYTFVTAKATSNTSFGEFTSSITSRAIASVKTNNSTFDTFTMSDVAGPVVSAGFRSLVGPFTQTTDIGPIVGISSDVRFGNFSSSAIGKSIVSLDSETKLPEFMWTITYSQVRVTAVSSPTIEPLSSEAKGKAPVQNYTFTTLDPVLSDAPSVAIVNMTRPTTYIENIVSGSEGVVEVKGSGDITLDNLLPDVYISTINKAKIRNVTLDNISSTGVLQFVSYADAHNQMDSIQANVTGKVRWRLTPAYQMLI